LGGTRGAGERACSSCSSLPSPPPPPPDQALDLSPPDEERAQLLSNLAACSLGATPPDGAAALLHAAAAIALAPSHFKARVRVARSLTLLGRLAEAAEAYDAAAEAARRRPAEAAAGQPAGGGAEATGESAAGAAAAAEVSIAEEGAASVRRLAGMEGRAAALAGGGRCDEALPLARSLQEACGCSPLGPLLAVASLLGAGRLAEAEEEAAAAAAAYPRDDAAALALARCISRRGAPQRALALLSARLDGTEAPCGGACGGSGGGGGGGGDGAAFRSLGDCADLAAALSGLSAALRLKGEGNEAYGRADYAAAEEQLGPA